jgi:hypothetical protein
MLLGRYQEIEERRRRTYRTPLFGDSAEKIINGGVICKTDINLVFDHAVQFNAI